MSMEDNSDKEENIGTATENNSVDTKLQNESQGNSMPTIDSESIKETTPEITHTENSSISQNILADVSNNDEIKKLELPVFEVPTVQSNKAEDLKLASENEKSEKEDFTFKQNFSNIGVKEDLANNKGILEKAKNVLKNIISKNNSPENTVLSNQSNDDNEAKNCKIDLNPLRQWIYDNTSKLDRSQSDIENGICRSKFNEIIRFTTAKQEAKGIIPPQIVNIIFNHGGKFVLLEANTKERYDHTWGVNVDKNTGLFTCKPNKSGKFELHVSFQINPKIRILLIFEIIVSPDPKSLWKDLPVIDKTFDKPNFDSCALPPSSSVKRTIIAASKRGRSHAHVGKGRDDDFSISRTKNDWNILIVADGAGSAEFSRKGSAIACETIRNYCTQRLETGVLDQSLEDFNNLRKSVPDDPKTAETGKRATLLFTDILTSSLKKAHDDLAIFVKKSGEPRLTDIKQLATTALVALVKKFDFGTYILTINVGDGAIGILNPDSAEAKLMCKPDGGEYAGQTRFITMNPDSLDLVSRVFACKINDYKAILLMTDGVSDAKFETDANLNKPQLWTKLWDELEHDPDGHNVNFKAEPKVAAQELCDWLDFWSKGNHDDRTIAVMY